MFGLHRNKILWPQAAIAVLASHAMIGPLFAQLLESSNQPDEASLKHGESLAHSYCEACHLFPEPLLLDKKTWGNALKKMAPLMGVARINLENKPDGHWLREANVFPPSPILSQPDWQAICQYYFATAPTVALPQGPRPAIGTNLTGFQVELLTDQHLAPGSTLVQIDSQAGGIYLGDARKKALHRLDANGHWQSSTPVSSAPVSLARDGAVQYAALIGNVFPSDEKSGSLVVLDAGQNGLVPRELFRDLKRPTHCVVADLNGDGRGDLVISQFGNYLGRLSWFENRGPQGFEEHLLLENPGALHSVVFDLDGDGLPDVLSLMAQAREGFYWFRNRGGGNFAMEPLLQFQPAFGSTYFEMADFNGDGLPDILATNGDNGEYASPFKRYHGVRIYLNNGHHGFKESWFFPLNGAFKAVARDFDGDGDLDIAVISYFPDYGRSPEESFVYLENKGGMQFVPNSFPGCTTGRWLTMDAADVDGDGDIDIVLGSFLDGPLAVPIPAGIAKQWAESNVAAVLLRNTLKQSSGHK